MSQSDFFKYLETPEFKDLLTRYESALNTGVIPFFDADDLIDIAEYYHINGETAKSEEAANHCLEIFPNDTSALLFLARMAMIEHGDISRARNIYNKVQEETIESKYVLAEMLILENKVEEADNILEKAYRDFLKDGGKEYSSDFDEDDEDEDEEEVNIPLEVAMLYADNGYLLLAKKWIDRADADNSKQNVEVCAAKGRIYLEMDAFEDAEIWFNKVLDIDAYNCRVWLQLCEAQFQQMKLNDALQSAEYAVAISPNNPDCYMALGNCQYSLNMLKESSCSFSKYIEMNPDDPTGKLLYSISQFCLGETEDAYTNIMEVLNNLALLPLENQIEALRIAATLSGKMNKEDDALDLCLQMEELGIPRKDTDIIRGNIYLDMNDVEKAMQHFIHAVSQNDANVDTMIRICLILYEYGYFTPAMNLLSSLPEFIGEDWISQLPKEAIPLMAAICKRLGKEEEYIEYLKIAVEIAPLESVPLLSEFFPKGTDVSEYVNIAMQEKNKQ